MLSAELKKHFNAALQRVLRPVVRQAIRYGVSYSAMTRMLKQLYVAVAEDDFELRFKRQTDSRLALLTGISRKEVSALRNRRRTEVAVPDVEDSVATHAVGRWMAGPPFASPDGAPRRLKYEAADADAAATFSDLVRSLAVDIPVRAVLDELIGLGLVELGADGHVELVREAHIPADGMEGKLALLGSDPAELFMTIAHNLDDDVEPWLQRKVVYDNVGSAALSDLRTEARRSGEEFIRKANALISSYDRDRQKDAPGGLRSRVVLGVYYFDEVTESEEPKKRSKKTDGPPGRIPKNPQRRRAGAKRK